MWRISMALRERQTRRKAGTQSHGPLYLRRGSRAAARSPIETYRIQRYLRLRATSRFSGDAPHSRGTRVALEEARTAHRREEAQRAHGNLLRQAAGCQE